jgi:hypothetical protein
MRLSILRSFTILTGFFAGLAGFHAAAEPVARDDFRSAENIPAAGWLSPWQFSGNLKLDPDAGQVVGDGYGTRAMAYTVDFSEPGDYWFRITLNRRSQPTRGNSYAALQLFNKDKSVNNRPLTLGIDSGSRVYFGIGENSGPDQRTQFGRDYTLVAHLQTAADSPDVLKVWRFDGAQTPDELSGPPVGQTSNDYDGKSSLVRLQTGNGDGFSAALSDLRIATEAVDVLGEAEPMPEPEPFKHDYRVFKPLKVEADGVSALPIQWAYVSLLPNAEGEAPSLLIQHKHPWIPMPHALYRPAEQSQAASARPAYESDLPLYAAPEPWEAFSASQYQAVPRPDGKGYDLFDLNRLTRVATIDPQGNLSQLPRPEPLITGTDAQGRSVAEVRQLIDGNVKQLADADGDGVVDLLVNTWIDRGQSYWPREQAVWSLTPLPHVGPHADLEVTGGIRGYDVQGNWLGSMRTKELSWLKGVRDGDGLRLTNHRPVYHGRDDFVVQWRNPGRKMTSTVIEAKQDGQEKRFVVLFSGDAEALALPVLDVPDSEELHLGRAVDLLHPDTPTQDLFLTVVRNTWDMTGDGRKEIVVGTGANGRAVVIGGATVGEFEVLGTLHNLGGHVAADTLTVPARGDWDGDGIDDLVTGDGTGYYILWPGTDDPLTYAGTHTFKTPEGEPLLYKGRPNLQGPHETGWSYSQPTLFDWDADGQLELIGNDNTNTLRLHQRVSSDDPLTLSSRRFTCDGHKLDVGWRSRMAGLSGEHRIAGDDRPVLLYVNLLSQLKLAVPEAIGSAVIEKILPVTYTDGSPIITAGSAGMSGRTQLSVPDWDGDGTWDIMFNVAAKNLPLVHSDPVSDALGEQLKTCAIFWLRNVGTNTQPSFERPRRVTWKDGGFMRTETHSMNVEPADLNGDGQLDLIFGDGPGFVYYVMRDELAW